MRRRVTLGIALAWLPACTLLVDLDGLATGAADADAEAGGPEASALEDVDVSAPSDAGEEAEAIGDASLDEDAADAGPCTDDLLVGNRTLDGAEPDFIAPGFIDTYGYPSKKPGTAGCVWIWVEVVPAAPVVLGVYATEAAVPSKLLAEAVVEEPMKGWNAALLSRSVTVAADTTYWIGVTSLKEGMKNLQHHQASCGTLSLLAGATTGTKHAPDPFPSGGDVYPDYCDMLAYLAPRR